MKIIRKSDHVEAAEITKNIEGAVKIYIRAMGDVLSGAVGTEYDKGNIQLYKKIELRRKQFSKTYTITESNGRTYADTRSEALEKFTKILKTYKDDLQTELTLDREDIACYAGIDTISNMQ